MKESIVLFGAAIALLGTLNYIRAIIWGGVRPNKVSWLMWSIAPLIATAAALSDGVRWAALPVFMSGFGPLLILLVAIGVKRSYWKLERFDYLCGIFSGLALLFWILTKEPMIAIVFAILSDFFALAPTFLKSWKHPHTEDGLSYLAGVINIMTSFFALEHYTFSELAFPIYILLADASLVVAIFRKRLRKILH